MRSDSREFSIKKNIAWVLVSARGLLITSWQICKLQRRAKLGVFSPWLRAHMRDIYVHTSVPTRVEFIAEKRNPLTRCLAHALFRHIIFFIPEALRHWTNKNMYYYRTIKYLYCLLKPYFYCLNDSEIARKFFTERMARLTFRGRDVNFNMWLLCERGDILMTIVSNVSYILRFRSRNILCSSWYVSRILPPRRILYLVNVRINDSPNRWGAR